jgi:hypothetical protein
MKWLGGFGELWIVNVVKQAKGIVALVQVSVKEH